MLLREPGQPGLSQQGTRHRCSSLCGACSEVSAAVISEHWGPGADALKARPPAPAPPHCRASRKPSCEHPLPAHWSHAPGAGVPGVPMKTTVVGSTGVAPQGWGDNTGSEAGRGFTLWVLLVEIDKAALVQVWLRAPASWEAGLALVGARQRTPTATAPRRLPTPGAGLSCRRTAARAVGQGHREVLGSSPSA